MNLSSNKQTRKVKICVLDNQKINKIKTTITGANTELPPFNSAFEKNFTIIHRPPLRCDKDMLHKEIEHVLIDISIPYFDWSTYYRFLVEARSASNS